jgi:hypothetical protein
MVRVAWRNNHRETVYLISAMVNRRMRVQIMPRINFGLPSMMSGSHEC